MVTMVIKQTKISTDLCMGNLSVVLHGSQCFLWFSWLTMHGYICSYGLKIGYLEWHGGEIADGYQWFLWLLVVISGFYGYWWVISGFLWLPEAVHCYQRLQLVSM